MAVVNDDLAIGVSDDLRKDLIDIGRHAMIRRARRTDPLCHAVLTRGTAKLWAQVALKAEGPDRWVLLARHMLSSVPCDSAALVVERSLFGEDFSSALVTVGRRAAISPAVAASVSLLAGTDDQALIDHHGALMCSWERPEAWDLAAETLSLPSRTALRALFDPLSLSERRRLERQLRIDLDHITLLALEAFTRTLSPGWLHPPSAFRHSH